jgi:hypothetical protein
MADFNDDELDKGFRRVIEGKSIEPPASLWADIRISALERQLIRYQSLTLWFKGAIGALSALLVGTGYFIYQTPKIAPLLPKEVSVVTKTDTVFVTQKVYVDRPVFVYAKSTPPTPNEFANNLNQSEAANDVAEADNNLTKGTERDSETTNARFRPNGLLKNSSRTKKDTDKAATLSDNFFNGLAGRKQKQNAFTENSNGNIKNTNFLKQKGEGQSNGTIEINHLAEENALLRIELGSVDFLEPMPIQPGLTFGIPRINFHSSAKTAASLPKIKVPLVNKLSVSAYVMPKGNNIDVRRGEPNAFKYGNEELGPGVVAGLRAGIKLTDRWSVLAGVEFDVTHFGDGNHRQLLTAELINGTYGYLYRTALGTVEIPTEKLVAPIQVGSVIGLEIRGSIHRFGLTVPLSVRYDVWSKRFRFLQQVPMKVQFYGLLSGYWQIPLLQEGHVEIFENTGRQLPGELTKFQNLHSSFGVNIGIGTELGIGKRFHVFAEPTYTQGITSVVRGMPLRSVTNSFGVKVGTKWNIKKQ